MTPSNQANYFGSSSTAKAILRLRLQYKMLKWLLFKLKAKGEDT